MAAAEVDAAVRSAGARAPAARARADGVGRATPGAGARAGTRGARGGTETARTGHGGAEETGACGGREEARGRTGRGGGKNLASRTAQHRVSHPGRGLGRGEGRCRPTAHLLAQPRRHRAHAARPAAVRNHRRQRLLGAHDLRRQAGRLAPAHSRRGRTFHAEMNPELNRRRSRQVAVGDVLIGGGAPIVVQSMTNTDTADAEATALQVEALARAGSELVRITVNTPEAAAQVARIRERLDARGCGVPLVGDFHYNGHKLLTQFPDCARALAKYRINPGNVGKGVKRDDQFATMIECALRYGKPVRIGVNWGSLDPELLARLMDDNARLENPLSSEDVMREAVIRSALESARQAEEWGLAAEKIVISCKMSQVQDLIAVYRSLARRCDYALHLGLTEAGMGSKGKVASSAAMAVLLQEGIGDTIRISLTPEPGGDRTREVQVAQELLQ